MSADTTQYTRPPITSTYSGHIPEHWGHDLISVIPKASPGARCLDHGCGDGRSRQLIESLGYQWVGIDVEGDRVAVVADGHRLPFGDQQFDLVISNAVFEHLYDPFGAAREIYRVMKPGGALVGEVAFLEPFHANSYFHMSHLGIKEVLSKAGFQVERLWPTWHLFEAQVQNMFPLPVVTPILRKIARWLGAALMSLRAFGMKQVLKRKGRSAEEIQRRLEIDRLSYTGSVAFVARKPK
jgi:ubiquinone/menaquinone biosynthesis C-methylase UbiE